LSPLESPVGPHGDGQALGIERRDLGSDHVFLDVRHVEVHDDEIWPEGRDHVLEVKVVEDRRVARHARVDDLDSRAARILPQARFQALGHGLRVVEAAAFGERITENGDPEDAGRLRDGELAITEPREFVVKRAPRIIPLKFGRRRW